MYWIIGIVASFVVVLAGAAVFVARELTKGR